MRRDQGASGAQGSPNDPRLRVPRDEARQKLQARIIAGENLLRVEAIGPIPRGELSENVTIWRDYNRQLLETLFDNSDAADNRLEAASMTKSMRASEQGRLEFVRQGVRNELTRLRSVLARLELFPESNPFEDDKSEAIMEKNMPEIFLCHSSKDKFFVRMLAARLRERGVRVWLDEAEMRVGDSLTARLGSAIQTAEYFGVVLSGNSVGSEWVQRELQIALQKEVVKKRIVVLPILLQPVQLPAFLADKIYADFTSSDPSLIDASFLKLLRAIWKGNPPPPAPQPPVPPGVPPSVSPGTPAALAPLQNGLAVFVDIRIVVLDTARSEQPDPQRKLWNLYLTLSASPPEEWARIFDAERRFPRHTMWRKAWVEGSHIIVHCVPDELPQYHLGDLKEDVSNANAKYRQYLLQESQKQSRGEAKLRELEDLNSRLDFG